MQVKIQKGMFESYTVDGDITEVRAALAQLGFDPSRYVQAKVDEDIIDAEEESKESQWERISYDDIKSGDIIKVNQPGGRWKIHQPIDCMHGSGDWMTENQRFIRYSPDFTYDRLRRPISEEPKGPLWEEVERDDLRVGDVVRVMLDISSRYEPERRVTKRADENGRVEAVIVGTDRQSPISGSDIYSSIQLDARRTGPEWETIEFKDIEQGDYVRTTYFDGHIVEGNADRMNTYSILPADWMDHERGVICDANRHLSKIERKVK